MLSPSTLIIPTFTKNVIALTNSVSEIASVAHHPAVFFTQSGTDSELAAEDVDVTCDGGTYQSEVSWSISDADGNVLLSGGAPYSGVLNPSAPPVCEDETACNNGAEGDCEYAATGYNCDGSLADGYIEDCVGTAMSDGYLSWVGDGYCDDGSWGANFQ